MTFVNARAAAVVYRHAHQVADPESCVCAVYPPHLSAPGRFGFMSRRNLIAAFVFAAAAAAAPFVPAHAQEDLRQPVSLPPEVRDAFLDEMRGHMGNLDDILAALAAGDFQSAADIADITMDFGHRMWESLAAQGLSAEEILAMKKAMRGMGRGMGMGAGQGGMGQGGAGAGQGGAGQGGMGQGGRGFGRFMPDDFRAMGMAFHEAASEFAVALRGVGPEPDAADYRMALENLQAVTANCRACHASFRLE
jgi:hypothetical protein